MRTSTRLAGFGAGLVIVLALGAGLGAAVGPDADRPVDEAPAPIGEGVVSAAEGYRLVPETATLDPAGGELRFVVEDHRGQPVRRFTPTHERDLHLILVSRELTTFHHLHPTLAPDGTWSIRVPSLAAGAYRAVADFQVTDGPRLALGTDLSVPGSYQPEVLDTPATQHSVDGYDLALAVDGDDGTVTVRFTVQRDGQPVDLQPYLGARGHLVAMRAGDLAYAHVHPADTDDARGVVTFEAELPSAGRYALFLDFKHDGDVRTASFTFDQGAVTGADEMEH